MLGAFALLATACSDDGSPAASGTEGDTEVADETSATMSASSSATQGMTSTTDEPGTSTSDGGSDTMDGGNFIDPNTDSGPGDPLPNGGECSSNDECQSGFCYTIPTLGGVCSECLQDSDCGEGESTCGVDFNTGYAVCTDGSLGKMCDSDEGCQGDLVCGELIDTGGLFNASFCSECNDNTPCDGEQICTPAYDEGSFSGHLMCADPGSVPDGGGCPIENGEGNGEVCTNGHCGIADVMGFIQLGVCGECSENDDCDPGETCTPASAGQGGLAGASCG